MNGIFEIKSYFPKVKLNEKKDPCVKLRCILYFRFIKRLWRGYNTCCRCDFEFRPLPDSNLARKREERLKKASQPPSTRTPPPAPAPQPHAAPIKEERREEKKEEEKPGVGFLFFVFDVELEACWLLITRL